MEGPVESLAPADQFFRALVLEEHGDYAQARAISRLAQMRLYTPEYLGCLASQHRYVIEWLAGASGPVVDLATGRGEFVEALARAHTCPIIATDFSPRILRRDRRWLEFLGLYDQVSLLAVDARRTPFKPGALATLTTNLGLPNIAEPERALPELRRIVSGTFLAISYFIPNDDAPNAAAVRAAGRSATLFRREALAHLATAGWEVALENVCVGRALPTPRGVVLEGAEIDGMPVAQTELTWGVLVAR